MAKKAHVPALKRYTADIFVNTNARDQEAPKRWDRVVNATIGLHDSEKLAASAAETELKLKCTGATKRPDDFKIETREATDDELQLLLY